MEYQIKKWADIAQSVKAYNLSLFEAIDDIASHKDDFYEVSYHYGEDILRDGALAHPELAEQLDYAHIPLSIVLSNNAELYIDNHRRLIPLNILQEGSIFGDYEILDQIYGTDNKPLWSISAGAKNIFSLQKLTETAKFKKLKQAYQLCDDDLPTTYGQHNRLFKQIAKTASWRCKILFFPRSILKPTIDQKRSHHLLWSFIVQSSWKSVNSSIEHMKNNLYWERLSLTLSQYNIKMDQTHIETLKHLIQMGQKKAAGFYISTPKDAPLKDIQYALSEVYRCRYAPDIISLSPLSHLSEKNKQNKVYYSFLYPTLLDGNTTLADNLRSYFSFCERIAYLIHLLNDRSPDITLPVHIYSSKKNIAPTDLVKSSQAINIKIDPDNLSTCKFFRACAEIDHVIQ